jgi:hypothetical protein
VRGVANHGHQPEDRAECQQQAVGGEGGKVIGRAKNGLEESDPHNADQ